MTRVYRARTQSGHKKKRIGKTREWRCKQTYVQHICYMKSGFAENLGEGVAIFFLVGKIYGFIIFNGRRNIF